MNTLEINPSLAEHDLARLFGGGKSSGFSRGVALRIDKLKGIFKKLLTPELCYRKVNIDSINNGSVCLQGGPIFKSPKLSRTLQSCETIICFIATIGCRIEKEIRQLTGRNSLAGAYILDSMGSVAVESMVEKFHRRMGNHYKAQEKGVTLRFSPGYCDWPVTEQKKLFNVFDSSQLGVTLSDSCLMQPRKSISGVFGVTPSNGKTPGPYNPCTDCRKYNCIARRG